MTKFTWPDKQAILDELAAQFASNSQKLHIVSREDYFAGFDRAVQAEVYADDPDAALIAALLFHGVVTRPPLLDGNKRLAWLCLAVFLDMNDIWFDPSEYDAYLAAIGTVEGRLSVEDLADFIRTNTRNER